MINYSECPIPIHRSLANEGLTWRVFKIINNQVVAYNIFENCDFNNEIVDLLTLVENKKIDFPRFSSAIKNSLIYYFWSKYEHEVSISKPFKLMGSEKVDIYSQVMMNFDNFINYLWKEANL